jgi:hypothetical protein
MPIYENGPVRIHYEEAGSGFPLLVIPGGGLNATIAGLATHAQSAGEIQRYLSCRRVGPAQRKWRPIGGPARN